MQTALQDHAVGGLDFVVGRVDWTPVDAEPFLPGEASRLALTRDQSGVEEQLRNRSRTRRDLDGRRPRGYESARLAAILARGRLGVKLADQTLREPLLDVAWVLSVAQRALLGRELIR